MKVRFVSPKCQFVWNTGEIRYVLAQSIQGIITLISYVNFESTPKMLDVIKFTMKLKIVNNTMILPIR